MIPYIERPAWDSERIGYGDMPDMPRCGWGDGYGNVMGGGDGGGQYFDANPREWGVGELDAPDYAEKEF